MTEKMKRTWHTPNAYILRGIDSNSGPTRQTFEGTTGKTAAAATESITWRGSYGGFRPS